MPLLPNLASLTFSLTLQPLPRCRTEALWMGWRVAQCYGKLEQRGSLGRCCVLPIGKCKCMVWKAKQSGKVGRGRSATANWSDARGQRGHDRLWTLAGLVGQLAWSCGYPGNTLFLPVATVWEPWDPSQLPHWSTESNMGRAWRHTVCYMSGLKMCSELASSLCSDYFGHEIEYTPAPMYTHH